MDNWLLVIVPFAFAVIFAGVKWLLSDWHKKSKEIQTLRSKATRSALDELGVQVKDLKLELGATKLKMNELGRNLTKAQSEMVSMASKFEFMNNDYKKNVADMKDYTKTMIKSEFVALTKQLILVKGSKNGQG